MNTSAAPPLTARIPRRPSYLKKVLVIDDEPLFTDLVKITLDQHGEYLTKVVNDPRQVIDIAREFLPDTILLDVLMPDIEGGEISRLLEQDPILGNVPVIMVTGLISESGIGPDSVATIHNLPALPKPLTSDKLVRSIEQSLLGAL